MKKNSIILTVSLILAVLFISCDNGSSSSSAEAINSVAEFKAMSLSGRYILKADLDFSADTWTPIGTAANPFNGDFNGNGKTITVAINNPTGDYQGVFGYIGPRGEVEDLNVKGTITGQNYVGGIAGFNAGDIDECCFTGTAISGSDYVGGIAGKNIDDISDCYNLANVTGTGANVGGIAGANTTETTAAEIEESFNRGTALSGIAGSNTGKIDYCFYLTGSATNGIAALADIASSTKVLTADEMKVQANFISGSKGFEFGNDDAWKMGTDNPVFKWQ